LSKVVKEDKRADVKFQCIKLKKENVSIEDILRALSDNKALVLFNTIALAEGTQIQIRKIGLTTRQYYSRLSRLTESGLITRKNGTYFLTLLGRIVYEIHVTTCEVLRYHWKLKAIESIQMSAPGCVRLPEEEFSKLVDILIDDYKMKDMVMKAITPLANSQKYLRQQKQEEQEIKVQTRML
jgi:hypothetical protein